METERDAAAHTLDADEGKTVTTSSCPHCGLEFGKGYAGTPLCRQPWGGSPPTYPNCILKRPKGSSAEERGKLTADAKSEATSDSTPAGAGPEQNARPYTPTPRTDKEARWGRCEAPDGSGFHESYFIPANLGRQLECELAVTRASEALYIARTQRAEYDLAKANTRADAEVTFRRYYGNQLANERKARADDNAVHSGMLTSARQRAEAAEARAAQMFERTKERCKGAVALVCVLTETDTEFSKHLQDEIDALQPEPVRECLNGVSGNYVATPARVDSRVGGPFVMTIKLAHEQDGEKEKGK